MVDLRKEDGDFEAYLAEKGTVFNNEILVSFDDVQFPMTEIVRSSFKKVFGLMVGWLLFTKKRLILTSQISYFPNRKWGTLNNIFPRLNRVGLSLS